MRAKDDDAKKRNLNQLSRIKIEIPFNRGGSGDMLSPEILKLCVAKDARVFFFRGEAAIWIRRMRVDGSRIPKEKLSCKF